MELRQAKRLKNKPILNQKQQRSVNKELRRQTAGQYLSLLDKSRATQVHSAFRLTLPPNKDEMMRMDSEQKISGYKIVYGVTSAVFSFLDKVSG